jgi:hypothetical protein
MSRLNEQDETAVWTEVWRLNNGHYGGLGEVNRKHLLSVFYGLLGHSSEDHSVSPAPIRPIVKEASRTSFPIGNIDGYRPPEWLVGGNDFPIVGRRFSSSEFVAYLRSSDLKHMEWEPTGITVHHTAYPHLGMRPEGFTEAHMKNLRSYYKNTRGWRSGPHLFTDDNGIWVLTPLTKRGVHAASFNASRIGIEMLGDFDHKDDPDNGRGRICTDFAKFAAAALMKYVPISTGKLNFHRHDPLTSKTCPGKNIDFQLFEEDVIAIYDTL